MLIKVLANQIGRLVNYSELSATLGLSLPTLKNYFWYAEETFVIMRVTPFFKNIRSEITKSPTLHFSDLGLRNYAIGVLGRLVRLDDIGFAFQNLVFLVLAEKLRWAGAKIHYWRTKSGAEIDFIVDTGRKVIPVEVKYKEMTRPMFPRSLDSFIDKYAPERCLVVNKNLSASVKLKGCEVRFLTVWDLLFEEIT